MSGSGLINITVRSDLAQEEIVGRVFLRVAMDRTLESIIDEFCSHKRIRRQKTFALRNDLHTELSLDLTAAAAGLSDGDVIYVFNTDPPPPPPEPLHAKDAASNWWILAGAALAIGLFGTVAIVVMFVLANQQIDAYGIVIDSGSSSSRVYVYTWPASKNDGNGVVSQRAAASNSTGPIESPNGIDQVEASLRMVTLVVPEDKKANTELFLGATAGMRLYERVNATQAAQVMTNTRQRLASKFSYKISNATGQIRIISGAEEGLSAWISVNYLKNSFGDFSWAVTRRLAADHETYGGLDLGGASTQIAFIPAGNYSPSEAAKKHIVQLSLYGKPYGVYSYSFLCYGKAQAEARMLATVIANAGYNATQAILSPCFQSGYSTLVLGSNVLRKPCSDDWNLPKPPANLSARNFTIRGSGDISQCAALVGRYFNATCYDTSCSFNNVYQPAPSGRFIAFSGFYYTAAFFNATTGATWKQFSAAVQAFCEARYTGVPASEYLAWYCFDGVYVLNLLGAFGFNESNWNLLEFADSIVVNHTTSQGLKASTSTKVGWSLGYMILQSGLIPSEQPLVSISLAMFIIMLCLFAAFLGFAVLFAYLAKRLKRVQGYTAI